MARWAAVAVVVLAPLVLHAGLQRGPHPAAIAVAAVQAGVLAWFVTGFAVLCSGTWARLFAASSCALAIVLVCRRDARLGLTLVAALSHAALYGALITIFLRSLSIVSVPVATRLALRLHGTITPMRREYTRRVTQLWAGFFAFELAGSTLLLAFAPREWWSWFVNVLDLPLVVAIFGIEFTVRCWWFRGQPHGSLADMARAYRTARRCDGAIRRVRRRVL